MCQNIGKSIHHKLDTKYDCDISATKQMIKDVPPKLWEMIGGEQTLCCIGKHKANLNF